MDTFKERIKREGAGIEKTSEAAEQRLIKCLAERVSKY